MTAPVTAADGTAFSNEGIRRWSESALTCNGVQCATASLVLLASLATTNPQVVDSTGAEWVRIRPRWAGCPAVYFQQVSWRGGFSTCNTPQFAFNAAPLDRSSHKERCCRDPAVRISRTALQGMSNDLDYAQLPVQVWAVCLFSARLRHQTDRPHEQRGRTAL
jgi:hypothetical protein